MENNQIPQSQSAQTFSQQQNLLPRLLRISQPQSITPQKEYHPLIQSVDNAHHIIGTQQPVPFGSQKANNRKGLQQKIKQTPKKQTAKSNPPNFDPEKLRKYKYYLALKGVKDKRYEEISNNNFQLAQKNEEIWNITQNQVEKQRREIEYLRQSKQQQQSQNPKYQKTYNHPGINDKSDQSLLEELQAETQRNEMRQSNQILKEIGDILQINQDQQNGEVRVMIDPQQLKYLFAE